MSASVNGDGAPVEEFKSTINCQFFAIPKPGDKTKAQDELVGLDLDDNKTATPAPAPVAAADDSKLPTAPLYIGGLLAFQRYSDPKHKADLITCTSNRELRTEFTTKSSTRHLEFALPKGCRLKYTTSFNLGVFPRNDFKLAARMARRLGVDTRSIFKLEKKRMYSVHPLYSRTSLIPSKA
jgi:sulfite reductase alpha subunit-like flavoprotein